MEGRDMEYVNMRSLQERPLTLGDILRREEGDIEEAEPPPSRPMGRTMSPTRCLGPLAIGRPRRARGRTLAGPSTSAEQYEDSDSDFQRRRRTTSRPRAIPSLARWRIATAEARIENLYSLMNGTRAHRRRGTSGAMRPRYRPLGMSDSHDFFFNPFSWRRRNTPWGRSTRMRSSTNSGTMSRSLLSRRSHRLRSTVGRSMPGGTRMIDVYNSRAERRVYRNVRAGRPHSGRPDPASRRHTTNGNSESSGSEIPAAMRRFIDFAAEFIPVRQQDPDAEPPEWSLNITAADFGPFAVGRSAISRARSLAIMGVLSQINDPPTEAQSGANENEA